MSLTIGVAVVAFDRPKHLQVCLDRLENSYSAVGCRLPTYVFQDKPEVRVSRAWKRANDLAMRYRHVNLLVRDTHCGVTNITLSISDMLTRFDAAIILEDDVWVSRDYIEFLVECLRRYVDRADIFCVCADQLQLPELIAQREHTMFARFFLRRGFAVWRRAWTNYNPQCPEWDQMGTNLALSKHFNIFGRTSLSDLLAKAFHSREPAYDLRWYYNIVAAKAFSLMPTRSLIFNGGYTGGIHLGSPLYPRPPAWERTASRLGFRSMLYRRFYTGTARLAGSQQALQGREALNSLRPIIHSCYENREAQSQSYATLLKRYQPRS